MKRHIFLADIKTKPKKQSPAPHCYLLQGHLSAAQLPTNVLLKEKSQLRTARSYPYPLIKGVAPADRQLSSGSELTLLYMCKTPSAAQSLSPH